jgi:hypothetical protein
MNPKPGAAAARRFPHATGSYESISTDLNNQAAKHGLKDSVVAQLRHTQTYQKKAYKQKEKMLSLTNQWTTMDKSLTHKNEYEKVLDLLKNTKLKGLTHEQLREREKHIDKLFKAITG